MRLAARASSGMLEVVECPPEDAVFRSLCTLLLVTACALPTVAQDDWVEITEDSETAMERGLEWLLKYQNRDGGFGQDPRMESDIACTSVVGLVLLSAGNTPDKGIHSEELRDVLDFILRKVRRMGKQDIYPRQDTQVQRKIGRHAHSFFAALFLSQIAGYAGSSSEEAQNALDEVVQVVIRAQGSDGAWGNTSWAPMLGTVMGWVSLRGAFTTGVNISASADRTADHLIAQLGTQQNHWMHDLYKNSTGVRVLYEMGQGDTAIAQRAYRSILELVSGDDTPFTQAGGEEFLSFHLITEVMLNRGGDEWQTWFGTVRDKLIKVQNRDGSWQGHHCITSRTFCTACAMLVLQAPYRYLPISNL